MPRSPPLALGVVGKLEERLASWTDDWGQAALLLERPLPARIHPDGTKVVS